MSLRRSNQQNDNKPLRKMPFPSMEEFCSVLKQTFYSYYNIIVGISSIEFERIAIRCSLCRIYGISDTFIDSVELPFSARSRQQEKKSFHFSGLLFVVLFI